MSAGSISLEEESENICTTCQWCMVIAGFFISSIGDGIIYTFGIMFPDILEEFKESREHTAWIGSLARGHVQLIGILVGPLARQVGCCMVTIIGAIIAAIAFMISYFAVNVVYLDFSYGILGGCGVGMCIHPAVIASTVHFKAHRGFAVGVVTAGSGAGTFILGPLSYWLISHVGWRGNCIFCGCLTLLCIPLALFLTPKNPCQCWKMCFSGANMFVPADKTSSDELNRSISYTYSTDIPGDELMYQEGIFRRPFRKKVYRITPARSMQIFINKIWKTRHSRKKRTVGCPTRCQKIRIAVNSYLNFSVLRYPRFIFVLLSGIVVSLGLFVPPLFLLDYAKHLKIDLTLSSYLFSIMGGNNMISRVIAGWLSDRNWANLLVLYVSGIVIGGGSTIAVAYYNDYAGLILHAAVFGASLGCVLSLRSTMIMEVMGMDLFYDSFSVYLLFTGIAALTGPPFAGFLHEVTSSYPTILIISGSLILSGVLLWSCVWLSVCIEKRQTDIVRRPQRVIEESEISYLETVL